MRCGFAPHMNNHSCPFQAPGNQLFHCGYAVVESNH
nr:MAG TPA: hypothetical protein [Bacteriophage sp.]